MKNKNYFNSLDIASEVYQKDEDGITHRNISEGHFLINDLLITNKDNIYKKEVGRYITIEGKGCIVSDEQKKATKVLAKYLKEILPPMKSFPRILIVGLGNDDYTPDSLGPKVLKNVYVTNHMDESALTYFGAKTCCFAPGVMSETGLESASIIKSIVNDTKIDYIIAIDSLCTRSVKRLNKVIQITNTGIAPGSGVGNFRKKLNEKYLGVPVIAIGVATVVDSFSMIDEVLGLLELNETRKKSIIKKLFKETNSGNLILATKEIDTTIYDLADIISSSINNALHD